MATGCITAPLCLSNMVWPENEDLLAHFDRTSGWLKLYTHSWSDRVVTVWRLAFSKWLPTSLVPTRAGSCVRWEMCAIFIFGIQKKTFKPIFECFFQVWKLSFSSPSSTPELLKMEKGVMGSSVVDAKNITFLFHLATGWHKYYDTA